MIILASNKFLQGCLGLKSFGRDMLRVNYFVAIFFPSCIFTTFSLSCVFIAFNINDFKEATNAMLTSCGIPVILAMYWSLIVKRKELYHVLDELQDIANESWLKLLLTVSRCVLLMDRVSIAGIRLKGNSALYGKVERHITFITRIYCSVLLTMVPLSCVTQYVKVIYDFFSGNYSLDSWFYHYKFV